MTNEENEHMMVHSTADDDVDVEEEMIEETQPFSLHKLTTRRFYLTRRGKVLQSTTEPYLRDNLGCGSMLVPYIIIVF